MPRGQSQNQETGQDIATIEGHTINSNEIRLFEDDARKLQAMQAPGPSDPNSEFKIQFLALQSAIQNAILSKIASERGVKIGEPEMEAVLQDQIKKSINQRRQQVVGMAKLPPTATAAEIEAAYTKLVGTSSSADEAKMLADVKKAEAAIVDNDVRKSHFLGPIVLKAAVAQTMVTEDDVKKSFDNLVFRVIRLTDAKIPIATRLATAQKAQADLKAGKKFEEVAKAIDPKMSVEPSKLSRGLLEQVPNYKSLLSLKAGEVSPVMDETINPTVYLLDKIEPNVPPDFDKIKVGLMAQKKEEVASKKLIDEIKNRTKQIKFQSKSYEAGYRLGSMLGGLDDQTNRAQDLKKLVAAAKLAPSDSPGGHKLVVLGSYIAEEEAYRRATKEEQVKMGSDRLEAISGVLEVTESISLRIDLAETAFKLNQNDRGFDDLMKAAQENIDFQKDGFTINAQITKIATDAEAQKKITPAQRALVQKELDRYQKEKADFEKSQEQLKTEQTAESKKMDAEVQKAQDEAKKAGKTLPNKPAGTTGSTK